MKKKKHIHSGKFFNKKPLTCSISWIELSSFHFWHCPLSFLVFWSRNPLHYKWNVPYSKLGKSILQIKAYNAISDRLENCKIINCNVLRIIHNNLICITKLWMGSIFSEVFQQICKTFTEKYFVVQHFIPILCNNHVQ